MKNTKQKLLVAAAAMMVAGAACADVVYHELFTTEVQGTVDTFAEHGWALYEGSSATAGTGTVSANSGSAWDGGPVNSFPLNSTEGDTGYVYEYYGANTAAFCLTEEYSFDMALWENLSFSMRHNFHRATDVRAAIKVDGSWYVSDGVAIIGAAGWAGAELWTVDADTTSWYVLNFTPGSELGIGATATLPSTGTAQGFGFYAGDAVNAYNRVRADNFMVSGDAIPEPATLGLFAGSFGLVLFLRRRRII